jgi:peptidyl-prolyl cis-trans isomerase SurA
MTKQSYKPLLYLAVVFTVLLGAMGSVRSQEVDDNREIVDRIIAVVGDEVILASELASQIQLYTLQTGRQPRTEAEFAQLRDELLDQIITERLFLFEARKDTSIVVRPEEVDQALDDHISRISANFESTDAFTQALALEGMTLRDLRKRYRPDVENQLLKQRFIQRKLYSVSVSRHEVEQFFNEFKDSIPLQPEAVQLAHILLPIEPSEEIEDSVKTLAAGLRQQVLDGADFATLSARFSSYGAGENGGDLGFISRTDVVSEFARAAFNLNVGDISGVVRTEFGYHVIKCEGKRGDRLRLRHILLGLVPSGADTARARSLADSLLTEVRSGADYAEIAKRYSSDNETRPQGGELGWFASDRLPPEFADATSGWETPGEFRGPVESQFGFHLLALLDYQSERRYSLEDDFDRIKELARQDKTGQIVDDWIEEIKARTHIQYRLDDV